MLEEAIPKHPGRLQDKPLCVLKGVRAYQLNHFLKFCIFLLNLEHLGAEVIPLRVYVLQVPVLHGLVVEGVALVPVYSGEVAAIGQVGIKGPEGTAYPHRVLCYRFREVTPGGRDCTHYCN